MEISCPGTVTASSKSRGLQGKMLHVEGFGAVQLLAFTEIL